MAQSDTVVRSEADRPARGSGQRSHGEAYGLNAVCIADILKRHANLIGRFLVPSSLPGQLALLGEK